MTETFPHPATRDALAEHGRFVARLARSLTVDPHEADDLVQETWLIALRRRPRPEGLRPWLATVIRKAAHTRRRARDRRRRREVRVARDEAIGDPTTLLADLELRHAVVAAVLALDEPYREVLVRHYDREQTLREIAEEDDIPLETVRTRHRRGLARLREGLSITLGSGGLGALSLLAKRHEQLLVSPGAAAVGGTGLSLGLVAAGGVAAAAFVFGGLELLDEGGRTRGHEGDRPDHLTTHAPERSHVSGPGERDNLRTEAADQVGGSVVAPAATGPASPAEHAEPSAGATEPVSEAAGMAYADAYWSAVRTASRQNRFELPKGVKPSDLTGRAALEAMRVVGPPLDSFAADGEALVDVLNRLETPGFPVEVYREVHRAAGAPLRFSLDHPHPVIDILEFVLAISGTDPDEDLHWTFSLTGGVEVRTQSRTLPFEHGIRDLLVDPADHFPKGADHAPLFSPLDRRDFAELVNTVVSPGTWKRKNKVLASARGELLVTHRSEVQIEVFALLEHLRQFFVPLNDGRIPGRDLSYVYPGRPLEESVEKELRSIATRVGWSAPFTFSELAGYLEAQLGMDVHVASELARKEQTNLLPDSLDLKDRNALELLRELQRTSRGIRWRYVGGVILVEPFAPGGKVLSVDFDPMPDPVRANQFALVDVRPLWPLLAEGLVPKKGAKRLRNAKDLDRYLRSEFAPLTWKRDPGVALWIHDSGALIVYHYPEVVRAMREHLAELAKVE